jgi:hypothetical protein
MLNDQQVPYTEPAPYEQNQVMWGMMQQPVPTTGGNELLQTSDNAP